MKEHFLRQLRDRKSGIQAFRHASDNLSKLVSYEISSKIKNKVITLIPIMRAGLALLPAFKEVFEGAPIGILGIRRDETTALPHLYYENLPTLSPHNHVLLLDPMLATGGSANLAIERIKAKGATRITLVSIIAAPEGIHEVKTKHPEVEIYTVAIDEKLDANHYIVPGLGDYGDRYFGT